MRAYNTNYDVKTIFRCLLGIILTAVAMKFSNGAAFVAMIPIALVVLMLRTDSTRLIYIVLLTVTVTEGNGFLMPKGLVFAVAQRILLCSLGMLMVVQIFGRKNSRLLTPFLMLTLYLVYMACTASSGWCPVISYLKLILFTTIFFAYYAVANRAIGEGVDMRKLRSMVLSVAIFFLLGSVLVIPFPAISYMSFEEMVKNPDMTSLFKGVTSHSQSLGPIVSSLTIMLYADLLFSIQRPDKLYILLLLCAPVLVYMTASRTAMASMIFGLAVVSHFFMKSCAIKNAWRRKVVSALLMGVIAISLAVLSFSSLRSSISKFVVKYNQDRAVVTTEDVLSSRMGKWEEGIENWQKSPAVGNGFQVSESMRGLQIRDVREVLTAPIEKSVWVSAILEEGGVFGFVIFIMFVLCVVVQLIIRKAYVGISLFLLFLISNLGEFTFFSMSGSGGFFWGLIFVGLIVDACRMRQQSFVNMPGV